MRLANSSVTVLMINLLKFYYEIAIHQNQRNQITWRSSHLQLLYGEVSLLYNSWYLHLPRGYESA